MSAQGVCSPRDALSTERILRQSRKSQQHRRFAVDPANRRLTPIDTVSSQGKAPRNFAFGPTARWVIVPNHAGANTAAIHADKRIGRLMQVGVPMFVPSPLCERLVPEPAGMYVSSPQSQAVGKFRHLARSSLSDPLCPGQKFS